MFYKNYFPFFFTYKFSEPLGLKQTGSTFVWGEEMLFLESQSVGVEIQPVRSSTRVTSSSPFCRFDRAV